ncbi:MAG: hypothetical protein IT529_19850 [Burkholderiales bacterium]|nr:hypothetical protein [Burkholderiales bacterium]
MSKLFSALVAALFAAATVTPSAFAQEPKKDAAPKAETKKAETKKADGKSTADAKKTEGKAKGETRPDTKKEEKK